MLVGLSIFLLIGLFGFRVQPGSDAVIGTLVVIGATVFFCWWGARLKQVSMDRLSWPSSKFNYPTEWGSLIFPTASKTGLCGARNKKDCVDTIAGWQPMQTHLRILNPTS